MIYLSKMDVLTNVGNVVFSPRIPTQQKLFFLSPNQATLSDSWFLSTMNGKHEKHPDLDVANQQQWKAKNIGRGEATKGRGGVSS